MKKYVLIAWKLECDAGVIYYLVIVNKHCDWFCNYLFSSNTSQSIYKA